MNTDQIMQSTREGIAKEFCASFIINGDRDESNARYALRDDASQWVRDIVQKVARTDWDRDVCCTFAETWADRAEEEQGKVIAEYANGCAWNEWRAIEWLVSESEHMGSADECQWFYERTFSADADASEIIGSLATSGQHWRASNIAWELWDLLDEYAINQQ
jgi:hypothetical protein